MKKFFIWLNNNLLPFNYSLWEKDKDEIYYKIRKDLRPNWLASQINLSHSSIIPLAIFVVTIVFSLLSNLTFLVMNGTILPPIFFNKWIMLSFIFFVLIILINVAFINQWWDKYNDKKYIELSKKSPKLRSNA
ncbi:MAG: hypothetical protein Q7R52_04900 [archaeon]|nr:hypothetical protein [archaeon]